MMAWYRCPVPRQYRWTISSQLTFRSRPGGRSCLCQHYASTAPVLKILLQYWRGTDPVVNFHLGPGRKVEFSNQVSANNRLRSNANTEPVQTSVLAWYPMSSTDGQLPAKLPFGAAPGVGPVYAGTVPVPRQYCKSFCRIGAVPMGVVNFYLGYWFRKWKQYNFSKIYWEDFSFYYQKKKYLRSFSSFLPFFKF